MKTSVINVRDMLSVLSVSGVEERIGSVPGVESVTVNHAAGSATVRYDETRLEVADIKSAVRQSAYESVAPVAPKAPTVPTAPSAGDGHGGHAAPVAPPEVAATSAPPSPKPDPDAARPAPPANAPAAAGHEGHEGHEAPDSPASADAPAAPKAAGKAPAAGADHHAHMAADFRKRFWISLALTLPILVLSPMLQTLVGLREAIRFPGDVYVLFVLASAVFWYGGWPFLKGLIEEVKTRRPGMMTLVAVAIATAYLYSSAVVFGLAGKMFFWELASLVDIMLLGHWIEMKSVMGASKALEELAKLMPSDAHKLMPDGSVKDVPLGELAVGDKVLIKPGEKVPADGVIVAGKSSVDEAMLTGESTPVYKETGAKLIGGAINGEGSLTIEVKGTGKDSFLSQVIDLVRQAQESKSKTQDLANTAALWLTIIALGGGLITFFVWQVIVGQDFAFAIESACADGEATLTLLRAGQDQTLTLSLTAEDPTGLRTREAPRAPATVTSYTLAALGVTLDPQGTVTNLTDNSPALLTGLAKGDRILTINGTAQDLTTYQLTAPALLLLQSPGGQTRHIRLDPWHAPEGIRPVGGANVLDPDVVVF